MNNLTPTSEQEAILSLVTSTPNNLLINALAGTGKTSTLQLIDTALDGKTPILYLAFNRRIVDEAQDADETGSAKFFSTTLIRTLNSQGHRTWANQIGPKLILSPNKTLDICRVLFKELSKEDGKEAWAGYQSVKSAVSFAKALGYIPDGKYPTVRRICSRDDFYQSFSSHEETLTPFCESLVDDILTQSIKASYQGLIDYNDQVYMPALFGTSFPKFPIVMVDEAQDLSPTNHALLHRLGRGRVIAVGDPFQSIYGFRGAKLGGMNDLMRDFAMASRDLSVSFRCPERIVEAARWRVPHLKWIKPGGRCARILNPTLRGFVDDSAIICRNNAPLIRLAFRLLAAKRSVSLAGSEIGPRIAGVMKKLGDSSMSKVALKSAIEDWRDERLAKESSTANDTADCMLVFADYGETLGQALAYIEHLFQQRGTITLTTGHKAKGLEWNIVYHLDPWLIGDSEQEKNLRYVIGTRSKDTLYELDSKEIK